MRGRGRQCPGRAIVWKSSFGIERKRNQNLLRNEENAAVGTWRGERRSIKKEREQRKARKRTAALRPRRKQTLLKLLENPAKERGKSPPSIELAAMKQLKLPVTSIQKLREETREVTLQTRQTLKNKVKAVYSGG